MAMRIISYNACKKILIVTVLMTKLLKMRTMNLKTCVVSRKYLKFSVSYQKIIICQLIRLYHSRQHCVFTEETRT